MNAWVEEALNIHEAKPAMDAEVNLEPYTIEIWFAEPDNVELADAFRVWVNSGAAHKTFPEYSRSFAWRRRGFVKVRLFINEGGGSGEEIVKRIASRWPFLRVEHVYIELRPQ